MSLPYKIATLVYCVNDAGQLLLLHRFRAPNQHLYSPIGGKLEQGIGESPYACALREVEEEIGVKLKLEEIRLVGMVSEKGHEGQQHWLMFCFEVLRAINFPAREIAEGRLEWVERGALERLNIPETDRAVIWPMVLRHSVMLNPARAAGDGFFSVHIDCTGERLGVVVECGV